MKCSKCKHWDKEVASYEAPNARECKFVVSRATINVQEVEGLSLAGNIARIALAEDESLAKRKAYVAGSSDYESPVLLTMPDFFCANFDI